MKLAANSRLYVKYFYVEYLQIRNYTKGYT